MFGVAIKGESFVNQWMFLPVSGLALVAGQAVTPASQGPASAPSEKKICRMVEKAGTIIPIRTCLTKSEWKQLSDASENRNDTYRNRKPFGCGKPDSPASC